MDRQVCAGPDGPLSHLQWGADPLDPLLSRHTPLGRVPVLLHGSFRLTETQAILRYLAAVSGADMPQEPMRVGQMAQVIGLADADVYPVMVRQVFSDGCYRPDVLGEPGQPETLAAGLRNAPPALSVLDQIAGDGQVLNCLDLTLADLHLAPMVSYFVRVREGREMLRRYPQMDRWWQWIEQHPDLRATEPLPQIPPHP